MNYSLDMAQKYLAEGKGEWLCHFIHDQDSEGISSPLSPEDQAKGGYISTYFLVRDLANPANWD